MNLRHIAPELGVVITKLPRRQVSLAGFEQGHEALSGSDGSCLLVANGLARRGYRVVCSTPGTQLLDTQMYNVSESLDALDQLRPGNPVLWCYKGDDETLVALNAHDFRPFVWFHNPVTYEKIHWLEEGRVSGIIMISDAERCPFYHAPVRDRLGRIYNPLSPFYRISRENAPGRYQSQQVVFTGHLSERKGAHRVLQMWPLVRRQLPSARLIVVGSTKLYGEDWQVGSLGVAEPAFEARYIRPIVDQFGSLEKAGVTVAGLLGADSMRTLYRQSALGIVNFNWQGSLEGFCISAIEMLADQLPVFSFARGALPETIGPTSGAVLLRSPDITLAANRLAAMLQEPEYLSQLGAKGRDYVLEHYSLEHILDQWEICLQSPPGELDRLSGSWAGPVGLRYQAARTVRALGLGGAYQTAAEKAKVVRQWIHLVRNLKFGFKV